MIKTYIILDYSDDKPFYLESEGLAKSKAIAKWIFDYCGWNSSNDLFPLLTFYFEEEKLTDNAYIIYNRDTIWILNLPMLLN